MQRLSLICVYTILALVVWTGLVGGAALFGWGRTPIAPHGDAQAFAREAMAELDTRNKGNAAFVLIEEGRVIARHFQSTGTPVNGRSLFQVASLSKWITAMGVMTLVEQGKLELDAPVSRYLTRWHLPEGPYNDQVTVRRILSHTAGFADDLGYGGFEPGVPIQSLEESLTHAADASPGRDGRVFVSVEPGSEWRYSGGGYTLLQLLVEEVSGEPFNDYMRRAVLIPFGMTGSTYVLDDAARSRVAMIHDVDGTEATHFTFTAVAAASLYTSTDDLTHLLQSLWPGQGGEAIGRGVLKPETLATMHTPEARRFGFAIWGLGELLYAPNDHGRFIVGHDGDNAPAINTTVRFDPDTGDGVILLLTGERLLASKIGGDWVFWNVGEIDLLTVLRELPATLRWLIGGAITIGVLMILALIFWRRRTLKTV